MARGARGRRRRASGAIFSVRARRGRGGERRGGGAGHVDASWAGSLSACLCLSGRRGPREPRRTTVAKDLEMAFGSSGAHASSGGRQRRRVPRARLTVRRRTQTHARTARAEECLSVSNRPPVSVCLFRIVLRCRSVSNRPPDGPRGRTAARRSALRCRRPRWRHRRRRPPRWRRQRAQTPRRARR